DRAPCLAGARISFTVQRLHCVLVTDGGRSRVERAIVSEIPSHAGLHLVVTVQSLACALPIARVIETMRPLPVRRIERAPDIVLGAAIIRGIPTPVVDASRLLG